jgi:mRNA interferase HigB
MRIVSYNTICKYIESFPETEHALADWHNEAKAAHWSSPAEVKEYAASVSILTNNRVCFNIRGNKYRLVVSVNYDHQVVYIKWFGTHRDYMKIDVETIGW